MSRRLLTYLYIDTSGSMRGEPIEAVNVGLQALLHSLRQNPYALESVHLSITTFDNEVNTVLPITPLEDVILPTITTPNSGATFMGKALEKLVSDVRRDRILHSAHKKGDWRPILVLLTDGKPSDIWAFNQVISEVKSIGFGNIIACAAGPKSDPSFLRQLTDNVVSLDTMDSASFSKFFEWISTTVESNSYSLGAVTGSPDLPPPPKEINIVL